MERKSVPYHCSGEEGSILTDFPCKTETLFLYKYLYGRNGKMGDTLNSAIDIAISKEQEAYDFYMDLYNLVEDKEAKSTLKYIAQEEAKHKEFLTTCQEGRFCSAV